MPITSPFSTHLGASATREELIQDIENRFEFLDINSYEIRIIEVFYTNEGLDENGCPESRETVEIENEKVLILIKNHEDHHCDFKWQVLAININSCFDAEEATDIFEKIVKLATLRKPELRENLTN